MSVDKISGDAAITLTQPLGLATKNANHAYGLTINNTTSDVKNSPQAIEQSIFEQLHNHDKSKGSGNVLDVKQVEKNIKSINALFPLKNTNLIFEFDKLGDPPIIKVVDRDSKKVIRQIPSKDLIEVSKALQAMADKLSKSGVLVNSKV